MGKLEEVMETIQPLRDSGLAGNTIIYHAPERILDIFFTIDLQMCRAGLVIHEEHDGTVNPYFLLPTYSSLFSFIINREDLAEREIVVVLSGWNVFHYLNIPYPASKKGYLENLEDICRSIQNNTSVIFNAFSKDKIEMTYNAVTAMDGNNENEMQQYLKPYYGQFFTSFKNTLNNALSSGIFKK